MRFLSLVVVLVGGVVAACGGSPVSPANNPPDSFIALGCRAETGGYRCTATLESTTGALKDITGLATWSTSDTNIAIVNSVGFVTVIQAGEVAIRAAYQGTEAALILQVQPSAAGR